ncbi:MAG: imelysin family protein [Pseudomonadota bacterium]
MTVADVVTTNANIAFAAYGDSLITAISLRNALEDFVADPNADSFAVAKQAWLDSNEPYGQTEVYRFRVGPIDALRDDGSIGEEGDGPEGAINAWPLAEALIDYVANDIDGDAEPEVASSTAAIDDNIIADVTGFPTIDASVVRANNELGGDERNVASGYHVIEFLLWGQDLNADLSATLPRDSSAGQRPFTDYIVGGACTSGPNPATQDICERRGDYLLAVADVLIDDLSRVTDAWSPNMAGNHYAAFVTGGDTSLAIILEGMGRLGFGELAGERMNIALLTNSQEDEHSCFSDNTHRDIVTNAKGIENAYRGEYVRLDGTTLEGAGIDDLLISEGLTDLENQMRAAVERTAITIDAIDQAAKTGTPFDNLIQIGINEPTVASAIVALSEQTDVLEQVIVGLGVSTGDLRQDTDQDI